MTDSNQSSRSVTQDKDFNNNATDNTQTESHNGSKNSLDRIGDLKSSSNELTQNTNGSSTPPSTRLPRFKGKHKQAPVPKSDGTNIENGLVLRQPSTGMTEHRGFTMNRTASVSID